MLLGAMPSYADLLGTKEPEQLLNSLHPMAYDFVSWLTFLRAADASAALQGSTYRIWLKR